MAHKQAKAPFPLGVLNKDTLTGRDIEISANLAIRDNNNANVQIEINC